jgi:hypothetical protein
MLPTPKSPINADSFNEMVKSSWTLASEVYVITSVVTHHTSPDTNGVYISRGFGTQWVQEYCEYLSKDSYIHKDSALTVLRISVYVSPVTGTVSHFEEWVEPSNPTKVIADHQRLSTHRVVAIDAPTGNAKVAFEIR